MRPRAVGLFGAVSSACPFPKDTSRGDQADDLAVPHAGLVGEGGLSDVTGGLT